VRVRQYEDARHSAGRSAFDCGNSLFNDFLQRFAAKQQRELFLTLWILEDETKADAIAGFYSLSAASIRMTSTSSPFVKKAAKTYAEVPVILLGRLAIDKAYNGYQLGDFLVRDGLSRSLAAARTQLGGTAMVVDPYESWLVEKLYAPLGFVPVDVTAPFGRQILPLKTVEAALVTAKLRH
jgi:hypothetical protein